MAEERIDTETHICLLWGNLSYVHDAIVLWSLVNVWDTVELLIVFTCADMAQISFFASFFFHFSWLKYKIFKNTVHNTKTTNGTPETIIKWLFTLPYIWSNNNFEYFLHWNYLLFEIKQYAFHFLQIIFLMSLLCCSA